MLAINKRRESHTSHEIGGSTKIIQQTLQPDRATVNRSILRNYNRLLVISSTANRDPPAGLSDVSKGSHCCRHVSIPALPPPPDVAVHRSAVAGLRRVHQPQPWQHRRVQGLVPVQMVGFIARQENARHGGDCQHQSKTNGCAATVDAIIDNNKCLKQYTVNVHLSGTARAAGSCL